MRDNETSAPSHEMGDFILLLPPLNQKSARSWWDMEAIFLLLADTQYADDASYR